MRSEDVDEYVATKLPPQHHETVERLRTLMEACAPGAREVISYGSPAWRGDKVLAIISPTKGHVTLAFDHGVDFDDPHGLLEGVGKRSRHVKLRTAADIDEAALRDYIAQAVRIDAG
jgi:hypothetical protein